MIGRNGKGPESYASWALMRRRILTMPGRADRLLGLSGGRSGLLGGSGFRSGSGLLGGSSFRSGGSLLGGSGFSGRSGLLGSGGSLLGSRGGLLTFGLLLAGDNQGQAEVQADSGNKNGDLAGHVILLVVHGKCILQAHPHIGGHNAGRTDPPSRATLYGCFP